MSKAIVVHETGGPDVLKFEDRDPGTPGPGEVLIEHTAIGLNFIDVYFRTGLYPSGSDGFPEARRPARCSTSGRASKT